MTEYYGHNDYRDYIAHYGVKGMRWGKHLYDSVVNGVYQYGANAYNKATGGALDHYKRMRANQRDYQIAANKARALLSASRREARGITPDRKPSNSYRGYLRKYANQYQAEADVYKKFADSTREGKIASKVNRVSSSINKAKKTASSSINKAKKHVSSIFKSGSRKLSNYARGTVIRGQRKIQKLLGKRPDGTRPHSRKKKYKFSYGNYAKTTAFKGKRIRR